MATNADSPTAGRDKLRSATAMAVSLLVVTDSRFGNDMAGADQLPLSYAPATIAIVGSSLRLFTVR